MAEVIEVIKLNPEKVHKLGQALPYGGFRRISKETGYNFYQVRETFYLVKAEGYNPAIIESALSIYNERTLGEKITAEDLK